MRIKKATMVVLWLACVLGFTACKAGLSTEDEVTGLTAIPGDSKISLAWNDPGIEFDHIELVNGHGIIVNLAPGTGRYAEGGLDNGTTYSYTLRTVDASGEKSPGVSVSATPVAAAYSRSVSGTISTGDFPLRGVKVVLFDESETVETWTDQDGAYSFTLTSPGEYSLTPSKFGMAFSPSIHTFTMGASNLSGRDCQGSAAVGYKLDPWGNVWEDSARDPATWAAAAAAATALGGRLPTPTEVYRNSRGTGNGLLRGYTETSYLWTAIENDSANAVTIRISDGSITPSAKAGNQAWRCVWPNVVPASADVRSFTGGNVNTNPGESPFEITISGVTYLVDTVDRAPLSMNAAMREAEFYGAFIPSESFLTVCIQNGLPNGRATWIKSSSHEFVDGSTGMHFGLIRWTGTGSSSFAPSSPDTTSWTTQGDTTWRFRCAAVRYESGLSPVSIASGRVDFPKFGLSTLATSQTPIELYNFSTTCDAYFEAGGHIPLMMEWHQLLSSGLGGGNGGWHWTSDAMTTGNFGVVKWNAVNSSWTASSNNDAYWTAPTNNNYYRPVYYPLNDEYEGPSVSQCVGGRFEWSVVLGGGRTLRIWADMGDRPVATLGAALNACNDLGGHLATKRDMVELIRHGLPNGSSAWLWTADPSNDQSQNVVKWSGTGSSAWSVASNSTEASKAYATAGGYAYRCVWTNEVRMR